MSQVIKGTKVPRCEVLKRYVRVCMGFYWGIYVTFAFNAALLPYSYLSILSVIKLLDFLDIIQDVSEQYFRSTEKYSFLSLDHL